MAEYELRQRKKEDNAEDKPEGTHEEIKSIGQDQVQIENKADPVRYTPFIINFMHVKQAFSTYFVEYFDYFYFSLVIMIQNSW